MFKMSDIVMAIKTILIIVIIYVPALCVAIKAINAKIDEWQSTSKLKDAELINSKIDAAQKIIEDIVVKINQTYVNALKKKNDFTEDMQKEAKDMALDLAKTLITTDLKDAIKSVYGDYDTWLDTIIESIVNAEK